jgi:hypothetical protein
MTVLTVGRPFTSPDATLLVENQLAVGAHLFQLVVVDDDGLASDPVQATVQIVDLKLPPVIIQPPVVLQPIDPSGPVTTPIATQPIVTTPIVATPIATVVPLITKKPIV